jgi:hypothetical protein
VNPSGTCVLCLAPNVVLIRSHIVSAWVYRRTVNFDASQGNALVQIQNDEARLQTKQVVEYLLCRPCEDIFSESEAYVAKQGLQADSTTFPLLDQSPKLNEPSIDLRDIAGFDVAKISHFAISVIWRADVSHIEPIVDLTSAREDIRKYLHHDAPLPDGCYLIMSVVKPPAGLPRVDKIIGMPFSLPNEPGHKFIASGLNFTLLTEQPPNAKWTGLSITHTSVALVSDGKLLLEKIASDAERASQVGKLARRA